MVSSKSPNGQITQVIQQPVVVVAAETRPSSEISQFAPLSSSSLLPARPVFVQRRGGEGASIRAAKAPRGLPRCFHPLQLTPINRASLPLKISRHPADRCLAPHYVEPSSRLLLPSLPKFPPRLQQRFGITDAKGLATT